jgi:uncharacterized Zn finger protein
MKIYLASPYSHPDPEIQLVRFWMSREKAAELMLQDHIVFSPIAYSHQFHMDHDLPGDWQFWQKYDRAFIEWCDEVWIYMLPGWQESHGVQAEINIAANMGKIIRYLEA